MSPLPGTQGNDHTVIHSTSDVYTLQEESQPGEGLTFPGEGWGQERDSGDGSRS